MTHIPAYALPALLLCPVLCAQERATDTHQKIAGDLINLLSETEIALNLCQDEESVKASLPRFRELATMADDIAARQAMIEAPTIQDDIAAAQYVEQFTVLWTAIGKHLDRLEKKGLLSDDLRDILKVAPKRTSKQEPRQS